MPYLLSKTNGTQLTIVQDGTVDTTTDLVFIGKNYTGYGDPVNENFVRLLENFANTAAPTKPLDGQLWFDTNSNKLKLYYGNRFKPIAIMTTGTSTPAGPNPGDLHFNGSLLYVFNARDWLPIGPLTSSAGGGTVQLPTTTVIADDQSVHSVIDIGIDGASSTVISTSSAFAVYSTQEIYNKYTAIYPGINLPDTDEEGISGYYDSGSNLGNLFWGTAASSLGLVDYTNSTRRLVRVSELATKDELGQFNTDDGITINNVFKLHITRNSGIAAANISNIKNNIIKFNINTNQGTYTNFVNFDATSGVFRILPSATTSVTLGSPDSGGSFSVGYITDIVSSNITATNFVTSNITGVNGRLANLTVTNGISVVQGITIGSTSTIAGSRILTTATLYDNAQLLNGAGYLTSATVGNYNVASVRGTTNQINVSSTTGNVTFSLPNRIAINTMTAQYISAEEIYMNGSKVLTEFTAPTSGVNFINGTPNQIVATTAIGGGTVTLSLPNSIQVSSVVASSLFDSGNRVLTGATGVSSFSGGNTGLTPFGASVGSITLGGILAATAGGTGFNSYTIGDILVAGTSQSLSKLSAVAPGRVLVSNGAGVAPKYDKVDLGVHITGTLPISNGGTGATTPGQALLNLGGEPAFPSGTRIVFAQTNAPTGWTKVLDNDNAALRVVNGVAGKGGSLGFTSVFTSRAVSGSVSNNTTGITLNITNEEQIENEQNQFTVYRYSITDPGHSHSFSAPNLDFSVKYVDVIIAQKN